MIKYISWFHHNIPLLEILLNPDVVCLLSFQCDVIYKLDEPASMSFFKSLVNNSTWVWLPCRLLVYSCVPIGFVTAWNVCYWRFFVSKPMSREFLSNTFFNSNYSICIIDISLSLTILFKVNEVILSWLFLWIHAGITIFFKT